MVKDGKVLDIIETVRSKPEAEMEVFEDFMHGHTQVFSIKLTDIKSEKDIWFAMSPEQAQQLKDRLDAWLADRELERTLTQK